jgi:NADH-quinone oxidoreductase subunit A
LNETLILGYLPIFIFLLAAMALGVAIVALSAVLGRKNPNDEKLSPYECGMPPVRDARLRFDIRFYQTAMLFILFDIEIGFLYPWAVLFDRFDPVLFGFVEMIIFIGILVFGYLYAWRKGALEWS